MLTVPEVRPSSSSRSRPLAWRLADCFRADWTASSEGGCYPQLEIFIKGGVVSGKNIGGYVKNSL